ncbi:MAG: PIN domain-containing protein [Reyranella sp.]|nr:PIN domain-containing protein [Reyranella sp.]MBL6653435.1 PIN domain-containing protein [Reyranella sp.]
MRIFLDANVLFSAARSDGFVRRFLDLLMADGHVLCADGYVAEEARRNLAAKGPHGLPALAVLLDRLEVAPLQADPESVSALSALPEKDRPVVAAAARMSCDALVTGDRRHFGRFYRRRLAGVAIHSPSTLAEWLL